MNERTQLIIYSVTQAILLAEKSIAIFQVAHDRLPTLEEWKAMELGWKSPAQIEAEARGEQPPGNS